MLITALTLLAWLPSAAPALVQDTPQLLLRDVAVVDTDQGVLHAHRSVLVRAGRIVAVTAAAAAAPSGVQVIDGAGRYLMPGLIDAHVHVDERDLPLFLANGVTGIRELNGSDEHLDMRARIAAGELLGPRMRVTSPLLAGEPQQWRHTLVDDPRAAEQLARDLADAGYDAIKVYDGLSAEVYAALRSVARERGLPMLGHIPAAVGLEGVLAAGQHLEHTEQIVRATVGHDLDRSRIAAICKAIADAGVTVTPTLAAQKILSNTRSAEFEQRFARPELVYVPRGTLSWWESLRASGASRPTEASTAPNPYYAFQVELVRTLAASGVPLLVGTDTPNPLLVPGFSIHDELAALEAAGLSRAEVLRMATRGAAVLLDWNDLGQVAPGQLADLVLLDENPFESLETLKRPAGVVVGGRWLPREDLSALLVPLERKD